MIPHLVITELSTGSVTWNFHFNMGKSREIRGLGAYNSYLEYRIVARAAEP